MGGVKSLWPAFLLRKYPLVRIGEEAECVLEPVWRREVTLSVAGIETRQSCPRLFVLLSSPWLMNEPSGRQQKSSQITDLQRLFTFSLHVKDAYTYLQDNSQDAQVTSLHSAYSLRRTDPSSSIRVRNTTGRLLYSHKLCFLVPCFAKIQDNLLRLTIHSNRDVKDKSHASGRVPNLSTKKIKQCLLVIDVV